MIKPPSLKANDTVAIIAPADRPREPSEVQAAQTWLEQMGYRVKVGARVLGRYGYLAGSDAERVADFHAAWADDEVRAIMCLRGQWGASRLLGLLDFDLIAAHPKIFVGCGDVTALLVAVQQRTGLVTFHGPNLARLNSSRETREHLMRAIATSEPIGKIPNPKSQTPVPQTVADGLEVGSWDLEVPAVTFRNGTAAGRLIGGSLSALVGLLGTPFQFDPGGAILFLEMTDCRISQFDRDLTTLRLAGISTRVSGLVLSEPGGSYETNAPSSLSLEEILAEQAERLTAPTFYGLPFGQGRVQYTLPIGVQARLDADKQTLEIVESATT